MIVDLSDEDREVLQAWLNSWDDDDMPLYGNLSYDAVFALAQKLKLDISSGLRDMMGLESEDGGEWPE